MPKPQASQEEHVGAAELEREGLCHREKQKYYRKLLLIGGNDPHELALSFWKSAVLPSMSYSDL